MVRGIFYAVQKLELGVFYDIAHRTNYAMNSPIFSMMRLYNSLGASPSIDFFFYRSDASFRRALVMAFWPDILLYRFLGL